MKGLEILFLIAVASASAVFSPLKVGESCDANPVFNITSATIQPFPIVGGQDYSVTLAGTFLQQDYVDTIAIGTRREDNEWHYTYQQVKKAYSKGTSTNFVLSLRAPGYQGTYTDQITLHRSDFSYLSCWQYIYQIN
jgi:hypothetical protein